MTRKVGLKAQLWSVTDRIPLVKETADPVVATALGLLVVVAIVGISIPSTIFPHDRTARSHVLQLAGGLLVVFGVYYTALTIRDRRSHEYLERVATLIAQLASPSPAVQIGTIRLLQNAALEKPALPRDSISAEASVARRDAILDALGELSKQNNSSVSCLAQTVYDDLISARDCLGVADQA